MKEPRQSKRFERQLQAVLTEMANEPQRFSQIERQIWKKLSVRIKELRAKHPDGDSQPNIRKVSGRRTRRL